MFSVLSQSNREQIDRVWRYRSKSNISSVSQSTTNAMLVHWITSDKVCTHKVMVTWVPRARLAANTINQLTSNAIFPIDEINGKSDCDAIKYRDDDDAQPPPHVIVAQNYSLRWAFKRRYVKRCNHSTNLALSRSRSRPSAVTFAAMSLPPI